MKHTLTSKYYRSSGGSLTFELNEQSYKESGTRSILEVTYLDETTSFVDWGYKNAGVRLDMGGIRLSDSDFETLKDFKKDNSYTEWYFHRLNKTWPVMIADVQKTGYENGKNIVSMQLLVTSNPIEMETS